MKKVTFDNTLKDYMQSYLSEKGLTLENASTKNKGDAFSDFYVKEILYYSNKLDDDVMEEGMRCDGKGDLEVDFAYKDGSTYFIYQMKYRGKNGRIVESDISKFYNTHQRITDKEYLSKHGNEAVNDIFYKIKKTDSFQYFFITNTAPTARIKDDCDLYEDEAKGKHEELYNNEQISWEVSWKDDVKLEYDRVNSLTEQVIGEIRIPIEKLKGKDWACLDMSDLMSGAHNNTVICTIKGTELKNLCMQHKESLFNSNIRGYLGSNLVNKQIHSTLNESPEKFYYFNNGLSAICNDFRIEVSNNKCSIICNNLQIINGAQTATCIWKFKNDEKLKKARVLIRITKGEKKEFNNKIIKCNNTQNILKIADFRSNDDVQVHLEKKFKEEKIMLRLQTPFKRIIYQRKRQKKHSKKDELLVDINELAKAICAFRYGSEWVMKSTKFLFDTEAGGLYYKIFGEEGEEVDKVDDRNFKEISAIILIWASIRKECDKKKKEAKYAESIDSLVVQARWSILWCFGEAIRILIPTDKSNSLEKLYNKIIKGGFTKENADSVFIGWFTEIYQYVTEAIEFEKDFEDFNFRNWLRSPKGQKFLQKKFNNVNYVSKHFAKSYPDFFKDIM